MYSKFYGQAERAISNGQLNVLLRLHTRPIKLVVYQCSCYLLRLGDLILRKVSRLYAFSVYPNRTSLPSSAPGGTTGTQEGRSPRSALTKGKPPQSADAYLFFNDTATTEIYTLSLHDALPISGSSPRAKSWRARSSSPLIRSHSSSTGRIDRKSTRLNSSHLVISYAVFCL